MPNEELLELLMDLRHDLGKHLVLPVAMLPADASAADLRAGLRRGLLQTRPAQRGYRSAEDLWEAFCADVPDLPGGLWGPLEAAVMRALAWRSRLAEADDEPIPREALLRDLRGVGDAISVAMQTLRQDA